MIRTPSDILKRITVSEFLELGLMDPTKKLNHVDGTIEFPGSFSEPFTIHGKVNFRLTYHDYQPTKLLLSYIIESIERQVKQSISFHKSPCHFGGNRYFMLCPSSECENKCTKLYYLEDYFYCRTCHNLTYTSNNRSKKNRAWDTIADCIPGFSYNPTSFDKLYKRVSRYPLYKGKPTKACIRLFERLNKIPNPAEQNRILYKALGMQDPT